MSDTNKEKLLNNYPIPVTIECTSIILEQMKECVFKIKNEKGKGTGFFCYIPKNNMKVMITNNHIIDENIIKNNKNILMTLNDDKKSIKIRIDDNRKIYTSKLYDTTIIEIKEDTINNYLNLDDIIFNDNQNIFNENIYIIQYPEYKIGEQIASVSYGILKNIENEFDITHLCSTKSGSSGSPILNILNNKVIGIHKEATKFNFNRGTYLKYPINEFINNINLLYINNHIEKINKIKNNDLKINNKEEKNDINDINQVQTKDKNSKNESVLFSSNKNPNIKSIKEYFHKSPLIGLENIGAMPYMNAILQCFCHIQEFINFFKYNKEEFHKSILKNKYNLSYSFKELIENLWPDNYKDNKFKNYYPPREFKNKISEMNPLFKGRGSNDPKDLINFIIITLHEELNKVKKKINDDKIIYDKSNKELMFNIFIKNFIASYRSIMSDLFYGAKCDITRCERCKSQTFNYQTYFYIEFPLEEVHKFKNNLNNFNQFNNNSKYNFNIVNIYDCFEYYKKINYLVGDNSLYCNYCKLNCNSSKCTTLTTGPHILILLLNRGKEKVLDIKISFYEVLYLNNYIEYYNTGAKYKLIGVTTHLGEKNSSGHFIAHCEDPLSRTWYKYNDSVVTQIKDFEKEIINFGHPYLLLYQKMN